jgi:hypothetical protein
MNKFGQKIGQTTGLNKVQKMENVGLKVNLHPLVLAIIIVIGIYILYRAFWPRAKTYFRWNPINSDFSKCKLMKNVASPAIGDPNLPDNQKYGCKGAVEIVNGTPIYQQWLCTNQPKEDLEPVKEKTIDNNTKHIGPTDLNGAGEPFGNAKNQDDEWVLRVYQDPNGTKEMRYYTVKSSIQPNTPWYKDCCVYDVDSSGLGGGGVCVPRYNK